MTKTISRRILCILLLVMIAICFCACSTVTVSTVTNTDGTIDELVYVALDRDALEAAEADFDIIKRDIELVAKEEAKQIMYQFNRDLDANIVSAPNQETREALIEFMNGVQVIGNKWEGDVYCIGIRFKNIDVYRYHYNVSAEVEVETTIEEHFLYDKVSYQAYTMYATYSDVYNRLLPHFSGEEYVMFELEDTQFVYTYITDSGRQHSNADYVTRVNGEYHHSWLIDNSFEVITFHYNIANRTNWILCILGFTFVLGLNIGIVVIIKNKLKKQKNQ